MFSIASLGPNNSPQHWVHWPDSPRGGCNFEQRVGSDPQSRPCLFRQSSFRLLITFLFCEGIGNVLPNFLILAIPCLWCCFVQPSEQCALPICLINAGEIVTLWTSTVVSWRHQLATFLCSFYLYSGCILDHLGCLILSLHLLFDATTKTLSTLPCHCK